jgi:uncharacterized membrane protein
MNTFAAGEMLGFGWDVFKKRPWFLIGCFFLVIILFAIISGILNGIIGGIFGTGTTGSALQSIVRFILQLFLGMGVLGFFLKVHDAPESAKISDFWHPHPFWGYFAATILYTIIVLIGLVLLIVPGVMAITALMFTQTLVIDRKLGPVEALRESMRITRGHRWSLLALLLLVILINIIGLLALIVGILISAPITSIAVIHAYRTLSRQAPAAA